MKDLISAYGAIHTNNYAVDQYKRTEPVVLKVGKDGKTYVSDRQLTIQFITNMNFW